MFLCLSVCLSVCLLLCFDLRRSELRLTYHKNPTSLEHCVHHDKLKETIAKKKTTHTQNNNNNNNNNSNKNNNIHACYREKSISDLTNGILKYSVGDLTLDFRARCAQQVILHWPLPWQRQAGEFVLCVWRPYVCAWRPYACAWRPYVCAWRPYVCAWRPYVGEWRPCVCE